ncbi:UDP-N-acetylmuramate dehydrogenase [Jiella avicenniae]|uniref:UDP-N-acetylenolpyruvoylglucosamine reductase n=1 Tax=Jiella avicenniae TaxID=2907202 RepID=A0A9X1P4A3_9HYPH|nr:UDP-N-acetylmuramate dehydrogenase [Jiella avicenniae]MCE7029594.1 UDP-N-acetylmuramate dehydrogenase [Jiella avicenniae]
MDEEMPETMPEDGRATTRIDDASRPARPDFDLSARNTLKLPATARYGAFVSDAGQIAALDGFARREGLPFVVIGGGSNVVLYPRIEAVVAVLATKGRSVVRQADGSALVTAQAGEDWPDFVQWTVGQGFGGLENLAGIPGTVGAAPVQNIGAYGVELADRFHSLTAYDRVEGRFVDFERSDCRFRYRQSVFKDEPGRFVITEVRLWLPADWQPVLGYAGLDSLSKTADPATVMARVLALRGSKLPDWRILGNAGSFFHNPVVSAELAQSIDGAPRYPQPDGTVKLSAGWLIERCGLKGYRVGDAGVFENHALVIVNHGNATAHDVEGLARTVKSAVREAFAVTLQQEPLEVR